MTHTLKTFCFGFFIVLLVLRNLISVAQENSILDDSFKSNKKHGFLAFPLVQYSPETRIALGISVVTYFRTSKQDSLLRPSVLHPFAGYTQNHQFFLESPFQLFFDKDKLYLYGLVAYFRYPYKYFGTGNRLPRNYAEEYLSNFFSLNLNAVKYVSPGLFLGFKIQNGIYSIHNIRKGTILDSNQIAGKRGGVNSGIGPMLLYDSRDNIFSSKKGTYIELSSVFNNHVFLSQYNYNSYVLDARYFYNFYKSNILALQFYTNINTGNVPFYNLGLLGGPRRMRGYYEGRYRDKGYSLVQFEYRTPFLFNRLGAAVFTGYGLVYKKKEDFNWDYIRPSYGAGIRIRFNRKELIHLRIDVARGYHSTGYYFILSEAF